MGTLKVSGMNKKKLPRIAKNEFIVSQSILRERQYIFYTNKPIFIKFIPLLHGDLGNVFFILMPSDAFCFLNCSQTICGPS